MCAVGGPAGPPASMPHIPTPLCRCATSPPDRGSRPPRTPIYEGHPFGTAVTFRRLEICVHGSVLSGPTGALGGCKIVCIAVPRLRLGFRRQRSGGLFLSPVDRRRGGTLGRPLCGTFLQAGTNKSKPLVN